MADVLDQSTGSAAGASATAPAAPVIPDLEATVIAPLVSKIDERFSGFQSIYDSKLASITRAISDLKTAGLSPEEQEQMAQDARDAEVQRLTTENALLRLGQKDPEAVSIFQEITAAPTLEAQLAVIRTHFGKKAADQAEQAAATAAGESAGQPAGGSPAALPSGNPNNPARPPAASLAGYQDGDPMTAELAAAILASANERGALFKARKG